MLSLSQQIRAGLVLNGLYERNPFVRRYVSLVVRLAPSKYQRLFKLRNIFGSIFS